MIPSKQKLWQYYVRVTQALATRILPSVNICCDGRSQGDDLYAGRSQDIRQKVRTSFPLSASLYNGSATRLTDRGVSEEVGKFL
jgi:hypothetical protein